LVTARLASREPAAEKATTDKAATALSRYNAPVARRRSLLRVAARPNNFLAGFGLDREAEVVAGHDRR